MKAFLLFTSFAAILLLFALQPVALAAFVESDCFADYEFSTGVEWNDFFPDRTAYAPGETIAFSYSVKSAMKAPIVEGRERVQIFYDHPQRGEELLDEFFAPGRLDLLKGDSARREFSWQVPAGAPEGVYTAKIYFIVGQMFNLGGLSLVTYGPPGVPGETTSFEVAGGNASYIYFDKAETTLQSETYDFGDYVPIVEAGYPALHTALGSVGEGKSVKVTMEVYAWDDLSGTPIKTEEKTVTAGESLTALDYNIPALNPNAYEVRLTAVAGHEKAMLKVRFGVTGSRGRFNYAGITPFPLTAGQEARAFVCMANVADHESWFNGSGTFRFLDQDGNVIFEERFGPVEMPPDPYGLAAAFTPTKAVTKGYVEVTMVDSDGKTVDNQRLEYDLSKFTNIGATIELEVKKGTVLIGEDIEYTISINARGSPISGNVLLYLQEPDGTILEADELQVNGSYSGIVTPSGEGTYTLKAKETTRNLEVERDVTVTTRSSSPKSADYTWAWIAAGIAAAAAVAFILYRRFS